jgi:hydrogenase nickel insertion protein HypA
MSLVSRIVDSCVVIAERNHATRITEIHLEIGDFSLIVDTLLQHAFDILSKQTLAEHAKLVIQRVPGVIRCQTCERESEIWFQQSEQNLNPVNFLSSCSSQEGTFGRNLFQCRLCGSHVTELIKGKNMIIKNIRII